MTKALGNSMELEQVVIDITDGLVEIDRGGKPFKQFAPGVGPYGEPQLLALVAKYLNTVAIYGGNAKTKRTPDLLIGSKWALEFKIVRPFGDNGKEAEDWSVNLLHPYEGNTSLLGDCLKLQSLSMTERKGVVVIGYEHTPPQISLAPLLNAFELLASQILSVRLGTRVQEYRDGLRHPVHQQLLVAAWEVMDSHESAKPWRSLNHQRDS